MRLSADEAGLYRLHLLGTLGLVLVVTLAMAAFYSWRDEHDRGAAFQRIEQVVTQQQRERLTTEMQATVGYLEFLRLRTEGRLRHSLTEQVDAALEVAQAIHDQESPRRPAAQVRRLIVEALRPVRFFDGRGYLFIDSMQSQFVLQPMAPQYEGHSGVDSRDDTGTYITRGLINAATLPRGNGFFRYRWYHPQTPLQMADKLAYVRHFAPYDWSIGTGDYLLEWENLQKSEAMQRLRTLRFGDSGSVGLIDADGRALLSPNNPQLEKLQPADMPAHEQRALQKLRDAARAGGGFVEYEWPRPGAHEGEPLGRKTALVSTYAPWGWVLVASMFNDELHSTLQAETRAYQMGAVQHRVELALMVFAALALGLAGSFAFSRWSRRLFSRYHRELHQTQEDLRIAATAFESQEGIFVTDTCNAILRVNRAFTEITGYSAPEAVGRTPALLQSGRHGPAFYAAMRNAIATSGAWSGEVWNRHKSGHITPQWLTITAVKDYAGTVTHYVSTLTDITQRKAAEEEIRHLAYYDPLTGLPNRRLLIDRLQHALRSCRRTRLHGALMFIDLDNFKLINDSLGHEQGDLLLKEMGQRLMASVREGDTVARLGGDEFIVVLEGLDEQAPAAASQAEVVAHRMLQSLAAPLTLAGQQVQTSCSIGVVLFTGDTASTEDLMKHADLAMYQAKESGRDTVRFFDPEMHAAVVHRVALERRLRAGLQEGQFQLHYQPQVNQHDRVVGVEGLARWLDPERGMVSPAEFIPLAEDTGLIVPLGQWVLQTACEQLARWAAEPAHAHLNMAVNVSCRQMRQDDFVAQVLQTLQRTGAPPQRLKLELTESLLLDNPAEIVAKMSALKARGVGFSLDDFGTGYSSLAYLRQLPLDQLKIDQSFVHTLGSDPRATAIVRTIATLADSLGLEVIAEGVETTTQREELARNGCTTCQGYLFSRPVPMDTLKLLIQ